MCDGVNVQIRSKFPVFGPNPIDNSIQINTIILGLLPGKSQ